MTKNKTQERDASIDDFLASFVNNEQKIFESYQLIELMSEWTKSPAKMWGPSIIGFGKYHYIYESGREGDAPLIAFSPRKAAFSLYVHAHQINNDELLKELGRYTISKGCIYVKKIADIDLKVLKKLCLSTIQHYQKKYPKT